jgi:hypothetical protein
MKHYLYLFFIVSFLIILNCLSNRSSSEPYISGDTFRSIANIIYDETNPTFDSSSVKKGDIIFVKTDFLPKFIVELFPLIKKSIILIVHNSDYGIPGTIDHEVFSDFLNSDNLIALFGQNVENFEHQKLFSIPIGIANQMWEHGNPNVFNAVLNNIHKNTKPHLLYMNFSPSTYPQERPYVFELFKNKPFCTVSSPKNLTHYLQEMALHKFTLSPRGNGIDCHRTWEALLVGSIPVVRASSLDVLYKNLPVLIVESWEQVTQEFLLEKYQEIISKHLNSSKKWAGYWLDKIKNMQKNCKEKTLKFKASLDQSASSISAS